MEIDVVVEYVTDDPNSSPPPGMYWQKCDHKPPAWAGSQGTGLCRFCENLGYYAEDIDQIDPLTEDDDAPE